VQRWLQHRRHRGTGRRYRGEIATRGLRRHSRPERELLQVLLLLLQLLLQQQLLLLIRRRWLRRLH